MIYIKQSTDGGAPSLSGTAGALITLLDYCLVTTAGWTKTATGTNIASYRPPAGNRLYFNVDDTGTTTARVRGFEVSSAAGVTVSASNTMPFPTDVQMSGGLYLAKSSTANATARPWYFIGNDRAFYLFVDPPSNARNVSIGFGDFPSLKASDAFNTFIFGASDATVTGTSGFEMCSSTYQGINTINPTSLYAARSHTQIGSCVQIGMFSVGANIAYAANSFNTASGVTYPSPCTNGLLLYPRYAYEVGDLRGKMPGLWHSPHKQSAFSNGDTITGSGDLAGRTFKILQNYGGHHCVETSDTWYS